MPDTVELSAALLAAGGDESPGSPKWWLGVLSERMNEERADLEQYDRYYEGEHPLFFATPKFREAFGDLFEEFSDNWCEVVVDASAERLGVDGFSLGGDDSEADEDALEAWKRNGLEAESYTAHVEAIKAKRACVIVDPTDTDADGFPRMTVEHPSQVIVATDPGNRRKRLAALKRWQDDDGVVYAYVYLPDACYRFRSKRPHADVSALGAEWIDVDHDGWARVPNGPLEGFVPVIPIENDPSLLRGGRSDLKKVIPLQNAINKLANDLIVASEFTAFRQRLLTGVEVPRYPEGHPQAGQPMNEAFLAAVSRVLVVEDPDARAQEFGASDLGVYVKAVEMFVQHLAAQTRTPPHYLMGTVVNASGDALKAAETGLVSKVKRKAAYAGPQWAEAMRLALIVKGRNPAELTSLTTLWTDAENRSEAEVTDAALKAKELEVPREALWRRIGATSEQIRQWRVMREKDLAEMMALGLAGTRPGDQGVGDQPPPADGPGAATGGTPGVGAAA